ncbi:dynein regulatory complex protein 8 isoform X1 [Drosophila sulfurigaster albostrigata]|uniref:dynein regulatory complex protein 8 isoform X1 n=1 Tax=Drosophila sulfurigaster albostrigata TaxID=89887 RepID=UPI002D21BA5B|nr:dynein regulatory complex protein 8 isoform X1 [Drosophila sulfurigaster albostrigata]
MEIGISLSNELEVRISEAFCIFDHHGDKYIDTRNIGNVLRFLGCVPTNKEVNEIIAATDSVENPGETHLPRFMAHVSHLLMERKMEPASPQKLLEAFEVLDPENKRFLTKEYFGKLMSEEGEVFNKEELDAMWPVAIDPITDNIPYIFYINKLKHKTTIYDVAEAVKEELAANEKEKKK